MNTALFKNPKFQFLLNVLFWVSIAAISASQLYLRFGDRYEGGWLNMFVRQLPVWLSWAILTPVVLQAVRLLSRKAWRQSYIVAVHVAIAVVISLIYSLLVAITTISLYDGDVGVSDVWFGNIVSQTASNLLVYMLIAIVGYALLWYDQYQKSELKRIELDLLNTDLQRQLTSSQLQALQMQIRPHFLFNTLHSVASLIRSKNNTVAVDVIANLSELLRYTLDETEKEFVTLEQELSFIGKYLEIERLRFAERLKIHIDIDEEAASTLVPNLILQPLVENALKHGFNRGAESNELRISARLEDAVIYILVEDNGTGLPSKIHIDKLAGIGLANTQERLATLYAEQHKFSIKNKKEGGVRVEMSFPITTSFASTDANGEQEIYHDHS